MSLKTQIDTQRLPRHIAIIMDGNGRWAKGKGKFRIFGHKNGVKAVKEASEACAELGVECLTLYAFSTENWSRPKVEVDALMELLVKTINSETPTLMKNDIRLEAIGDLQSLPGSCHKELMEAIETTKDNKRMSLILALSYSAKWDILNGVKRIAEKVKAGELEVNAIDDTVFSEALSTYRWPHPELLIRTSGEQRISNFLLWELAYSELYFTPTLWPDFSREDLYAAIIDYQKEKGVSGKRASR